MKKIFILLYLSLSILQAGELEWESSYAKAKLKAQEKNKSIMLLVTSKSCKWCRKLENTTLKDKKVIEHLSKDYVLVHLRRCDKNYPEHIKVGSVPATFFLDAKGNLIIKRVVGYWNAEDYLSYMNDVDYKLGKRKSLQNSY